MPLFLEPPHNEPYFKGPRFSKQRKDPPTTRIFYGNQAAGIAEAEFLGHPGWVPQSLSKVLKIYINQIARNTNTSWFFPDVLNLYNSI